MATLRDWLLEFAQGEPVEGVVVGEPLSPDSPESARYADCPKNKLMSWAEAQPWLTLEFNDGRGPHCPPITAWTSSRVVAIAEHEGMAAPFSLPRDPCGHRSGFV